MPKFRPYESPFEILTRKISVLEHLSDFYYQYNKFDDPISTLGRDPRSKLSPYFLGGFNPLFAMAKDAVDTFKPYKASFYVARDLIQPFRGIGNTLRGIFNIVVTPFLFLANTFRYAYYGIKYKDFSFFKNSMARNGVKSAGGILDGITSVIRGAAQVITTPFTWFIRMPLRGIITAVKGMPTVVDLQKEKAEKITALVEKQQKTLEDGIKIDREICGLYRKVTTATKRNQEVGADAEKLDALFSECSKFTEKRLNSRGPLQAQAGVVDEDGSFYHVRHDKNAHKNALKFLGMFTQKKISDTDESEAAKAESDDLNQALLAYNRVTGNAYI